jgi:pimeloyl-ACP methyl ester carboxylesterase
LIPVLPSLVAAAENGDMALATAAYVELISQAAAASAEGLYYAVECRERYPFSDLEAVEIQQQEEPAYLVAAAAAETEAEGCLVWEAPPADESVTEPITSSVPVLVLAGRFDPITPPEWGRQIADAQPTAYYVEFPHIGHGATGDSCANEIVAAFLTDPATEPDTSCVGSIAPIAWVLP